ncbi:MAG: carboxypeptidase regulatory-like domain-containing protein, partial [Candidatus Aminicenantes bacterium]|nr:carboxypeptidase regulatory-like domain-containing protein [Candidatus Aminicenantes bacterium]
MKRFIIWSFCALILSAWAYGQDRGNVDGLVQLSDRRPAENVLVKISGDLLPAGRTFTTGRDGQFRFRGLLPGKYAIEATHTEMASLN